MNKILILCPSNIVTGGIELLHQLVSVLRQNNYDAYICYIGKNNKIPDAYKNYDIKLFDINERTNEDTIVLPEVFFYMLPNFKQTKNIILWWLSIDNFIKTDCSFSYLFEKKFYNKNLHKQLLIAYLKKIIKLFLLRFDIFKTISISSLRKYNNVINAYQSEYALDFCKCFGLKNTYPLSDFINTEFETLNKINKEDIIIYNPKKGKKFTEKLISNNKDLNFVPIINLTRNQVKELMYKAKIYIDYGNHPGKDRMPREACLCNCIILTGKDGAAFNDKDIQIPEYYKDDAIKNNIKLIGEKIHNCLINYNNQLNDFEEYRSKILSEKEKFIEQTLTLFSQLK